MRLQARFAVWLGAAFVVLLVIVSGLMYRAALNREEQNAYKTITELIAAIDATQDYIRETARPKAFELLGKDEFVPELMSTSYVARQVADRVLAEFPAYHFKFATLWPHNPTNLADPAEREIIARFRADPGLREWRGIIERNGREYLSVARPLVYAAECLLCHGERHAAPRGLLSRYPDSQGFDVPEGAVAIKSVGVPLSMTLAAGIRDALVRLWPIILLMALLLMTALRLFRRFVTAPILALKQGAFAIEQGNYTTAVAANGSDEFRGLAHVFNHMARGILLEVRRRESAQRRIEKDYESQRALAAVLETALQPLPLAAKLQRTLEVILAVPWFPAHPRGSIFLWDEAAAMLRLAAHQGHAPLHQQQCATVAPGQCICGITAQTRTFQFVPLHEGADAPNNDHGHYCVPITTGPRLLGVISIYTKPGHERQDNEVEFLHSVAHALAGVIERAGAEEALARSRTLLAEAERLSHTGAWEWDVASDRWYFSEEWCAIHGTAPQELTTADLIPLAHPQDRVSVMQAFAAVRDGIGPYDLEHRIIRQDNGEMRSVRSYGHHLLDDQGKVTRVYGFTRDITEQKQAQDSLLQRTEELTRMNAELEEFAYVASHDLKAPLRAVANLALVVDEDAAEGGLDEENRRRLRLMRERVKQMDALIEGLLSYARLGRAADRSDTVELHALLNEVVDGLSLPPGFRVAWEAPLPALMGDRRELRQIFQNLITNAAEHHDRPAQGWVRVQARADDRDWVVEVVDNGPGVPTTERDRVFRMFSTGGRPGHTGIGLAVVRKLVIANGGQVEATDNEPRGAVFRVRWPRR